MNTDTVIFGLWATVALLIIWNGSWLIERLTGV